MDNQGLPVDGEVVLRHLPSPEVSIVLMGELGGQSQEAPVGTVEGEGGEPDGGPVESGQGRARNDEAPF